MVRALLGGSGVVIRGVIRRVTILISPSRGLITPLITAQEPPSVRVYRAQDLQGREGIRGLRHPKPQALGRAPTGLERAFMKLRGVSVKAPRAPDSGHHKGNYKGLGFGVYYSVHHGDLWGSVGFRI